MEAQTNMDIAQRVAEVQSQADLATFVALLARDLEHHADQWETKNLLDFLHAMAAWIRDMDGYYANSGKPMPLEPSWLTIAEILAASRIYE